MEDGGDGDEMVKWTTEKKKQEKQDEEDEGRSNNRSAKTRRWKVQMFCRACRLSICNNPRSAVDPLR